MITDAQKARNAERLATLLPEVEALAKRHIEHCAQAGIDLIVTQAMRTMDEQAAIYAVGRTIPGRKVTNAAPGSSWHNYGRAYDVAVVEAGNIVWSGPKYAQAGQVGIDIGLTWGGGFKSIKGDIGHFEYHPGLTIAQAREQAGITGG